MLTRSVAAYFFGRLARRKSVVVWRRFINVHHCGWLYQIKYFLKHGIFELVVN